MKLTKKMAQVELKMSKENTTGKMGLSWMVHCMEHFGLKEIISDEYWEKKKSNREIDAYKKIMAGAMSSVSGRERVEDVEILRADQGLLDSLGWEEFVGADAMLDYHGNVRANGKNRKVNEAMVIKTMKKITEEELTYDNDATYLDSKKESAAYSYKGRKQFSGLIGCIDEIGMINTVEYRRGNVSPATGIFNQLRKACHQAKKAGKRIKNFRSDSAADQDEIFGYCDKEGVEYYVSLNQNKGIKKCIEKVKASQWKKMEGKYSKNIEKRWAVTEYRRSKGYKIRILILRWPNPKPDLFEGQYCYHAMTTNNWEIKPLEWLEIHNGRMGSIEHMNDEIKNDLGCDYTPSHEFEKNRGYFLLGVMAYNMLQILKRFYMGMETIRWTVKRIRNYFINVCGKIVKTGRKFYCTIVNTTQETFELFRNCKSKLIINGY